MRKAIKVAVIILIIAGVGFGGYFAFSFWQRQQMRTTMAANIADAMAAVTAEKGEIKEIVSASGIVKLHDEISVYANIQSSNSATAASEKVSEVLVDVGDAVKQDQIIVTYDIESQKAQLEKQISQSSNNVKSQQLSLQSMTAPPASSTVKQLQSSVDTAEKNLYDANATVAGTKNKISDQQSAIETAQKSLETAQKDVTSAETDIENNKQLFDIGGISQEAFNKFSDDRDLAVTAVEKAETALQTAYNTLRDLEQTLSSNEMNVVTSQKNLDTARQNLADANKVLADEADRIKYEQQEISIENLKKDLTDYEDQLQNIVESSSSPIDGTVTAVNVSKGSSVTSSTVLVTIADFHDLIVTASISEYDVPKLALGQAVVMTSDGMQGVEFNGEVIKIGDSAVTQNASSGTETVVPVEVSLENADGKLKPGFNLDLEIIVANNPNAITVPIESVMKDAATGGYYVFMIENDLLKRIDVTLGATSDMTVEIANGLKEGDSILQNPSSDMQDGMPANAVRMNGMNGQNRPDGGPNMMFGVPGGGQGARPAGGGAVIRTPGGG